MRIKSIQSQSRRDFTAILECEHCGAEQFLGSGYDDDNYHSNVIPRIKCKSCGEVAPDNYRPLKTKYESWEVV